MIKRINNWVFETLERVNKHIEKVLEKREHDYYVKYIDREVVKLGVDNKAVLQLTTMANVALTNYGSRKFNGLRGLPVKAIIDLTLKAGRSIHQTIGGIVALQPMQGPVAQVFFYQKEEREETAMDEETKKWVAAGGKRLHVSIKAQAVEARARKLGINIPADTFESQNEMVKETLLQAVANEIAHEYVVDTINDIRKMAEPRTADFDLTGNTVNDIDNLVDLIINEHSEIKKESATFGHPYIIVSPLVVTLLQMGQKHKLTASGKGVGDITSLAHVGTLSEKDINVFCHLPHNTEDAGKIFLGIKGKGTEIVAGHIVAPYDIASMGGYYIDANTFTAVSQVGTRVGKHIINANLYRAVSVKNLTLA